MEDELLEPLKGYNSLYKDKHLKNIEDFFDELTRKGNVNVEANKNTVKDYKARLLEIESLNKKIRKLKTIKVLLIVLICIAFIAVAICMYNYFSFKNMPIWVLILIVILAVGIITGSFLLIQKNIVKDIEINKEKIKKPQEEAKKLLSEAWAQMSGLNSLYDWGMAAKLVEKTVPLIQMDEHLDAKRFAYLHEKYGLAENDENISTYFVQSGTILGNPFLLCKDYIQTWINKTYTGTRIITWTETRVNSEGKTETVHRSQTLVATVVRPAPSYNYKTYLVYGNEAAPDLTFSRKPTIKPDDSEKDLDKKVNAGRKKLDKLARKAVSKGTNYTRLGNDEFEVLFGGTNRDNEVQFRLLFTPLAQNNLLELMKNPDPFGDDFALRKYHKLNFVETYHSQRADYYGNPAQFVDYDYESARTKFINYNVTYFKNLYFELAPLMCIPLYQQYKSKEFIYNENVESNISGFEHEVLANSFNIDLLKPAYAFTPSILKTSFEKKQGEVDTIKVTAHSFIAQRRVSFIPRLGGDGMIHQVPVYWLEYIPVEKTTSMAVMSKNSSRSEFNNRRNSKDFNETMENIVSKNAYLYERGLFAFLLDKELSENDITNINKAYSMSESKNSEDIVNIVQKEIESFNNHEKENLSDEKAMEDMLTNDKIEAKEVEIKEEEIILENESQEDDDDDDEE